MNRFDPVSAQLVGRVPKSGRVEALRFGTWAVLGLSVVLGVVLGIHRASNPADQIAQAMAALHPALLLGDFWALGLALFRKSDRTPLRVPVKTPLVVGGFHLLVGIWAFHLASFEVYYWLEPVDALGGVYLVRWGITVVLGLLALISLAAAFFETRLVHWVLISEQTAGGGSSAMPDMDAEPDMRLGSEHIYEAQMLLNNLGYDVGGIDGEIKAETREALEQFQKGAGLEQSGDVTVLTMIELRNLWAGREAPPPGQSVKAFSGHVARQMSERVTDWWRQHKG